MASSLQLVQHTIKSLYDGLSIILYGLIYDKKCILPWAYYDCHQNNVLIGSHYDILQNMMWSLESTNTSNNIKQGTLY